TINLTATSGIFWILLDEFTPPTGTTDICFNGATYMVNDTGATFPAFNTLDNDELIWCVSFATTTTTSPGTGFTAGQGGGTQRTSQWKIQSSPATVTPAFSAITGGGNTWAAAFSISPNPRRRWKPVQRAIQRSQSGTTGTISLPNPVGYGNFLVGVIAIDT